MRVFPSIALVLGSLVGLNVVVVNGFVSTIRTNNPSVSRHDEAPRFLSDRCHQEADCGDKSVSHKDTPSLPSDFLQRHRSAIAIDFGKAFVSALVIASLSLGAAPSPSFALTAADGASSVANAKITTGGASTLQSGRTIAITRGVNLDRSDFSNLNLKGVAFQQSIVRDANFENSNLVGASFFDATVDGSNFINADLTQANFEMAQFNRATVKNAILRDMYVSGSTLFTGIKDIEGSDWTDTYLRADQKKYLCAHPTAKGINPKTGVDTRESLMCID